MTGRMLPGCAAIVVLAVAPGAAGVPVPRPQGGAALPNVLIVTLDTARRDFLGCYGREPSLTPHLDAAAAECLVFEDAYTVAPLTLPAHAALMTGRSPAALGVRVNTLMKVPAAATTLAELLGAAGYHTAAVVSAFVLDPGFGIGQGFERYHAPPYGAAAAGGMAERPAAASVDLALEELDRLEPPWFLWLHLFDPHFPYAPPDLGMDVEEQNPGNREQRYAAEIRYADEHLGRLFAALETRDLWDSLVLVFAADHGESMGDTPETSHGHFLYDPTMRIPLFLRAPGLAPGRCATQVSLVDVAPTVLALAGLEEPAGSFDGADLLPVLRGTAPAPERVLSLESYEVYLSYGWAPFEGLVQGPFKFIHSHRDELYDRSTDPLEKENLVEEQPQRAAALRARVEELFSAAPALAPEPAALGEDERQALAQLGYVEAQGGAAGPRPAMEELPDATQKVAVLRQMDAATFAFLHGHAEQGLELVREICRQEPHSGSFHERLGTALLRYRPDRLDEAEQVLRRAAELMPGSAPTRYCLGLIAGKRYRQAAREAEVLALEGDQDGAARLWEDARELRHVALEELEKALELEPGRLEAMRGIALLEQERAEEAERGGNTERALRLYGESLEQATRYLERLPPDHPQRAGFENLCDHLRARIEALERG